MRGIPLSNPRIMLMGHGRHGKGSVCEILTEHYGYSCMSSSEAAGRRFVYPALKEFYDTFEDCFADRHNWRPLWAQLIRRYNFNNKARLGSLIFNERDQDVYDGCRQGDEFNAIKDAGLFDYAIWVDASKRKPMESSESMTVNRSMCDDVIDNNGPEHALEFNVRACIDGLKFLRSHRQ